MYSPHLLIDVSNLAHRAFHALGNLTYGGEDTAVLYGVFRDIVSLQDLFNTKKLGFCFDGGIDKRQEIFPAYKCHRQQRRKEMSGEERDARSSLRKQLYRLRTKLLPEAGYHNIFWQEGYEADDVLASVTRSLLNDEDDSDVMIVSSDQDFYQLLNPRVRIWHPVKKAAVSEASFTRDYGLSPLLWADCKAIAGCTTDGVPGVQGVGEKTAAKFLTGKLPITTKKYKAILDGKALRVRNLKLVRLPFPGVQRFDWVDDKVSPRVWDKMMDSLGMKSLRKGLKPH